MSRRQDDAQKLVDAIDEYVALRFGISPRYLPIEHQEHERFVAERLVKAIMQATGNPEPE